MKRYEDMDYEGHQRQFIVGKTYLTQEGKRVKIIAESNTHSPYYTCVQGDDGVTKIYEHPVYPGIYEIVEGSESGWRYDRASDCGRCTGSAFDMSDPRNLVVGSEQDE